MYINQYKNLHCGEYSLRRIGEWFGYSSLTSRQFFEQRFRGKSLSVLLFYYADYVYNYIKHTIEITKIYKETRDKNYEYIYENFEKYWNKDGDSLINVSVKMNMDINTSVASILINLKKAIERKYGKFWGIEKGIDGWCEIKFNLNEDEIEQLDAAIEVLGLQSNSVCLLMLYGYYMMGMEGYDDVELGKIFRQMMNNMFDKESFQEFLNTVTDWMEKKIEPLIVLHKDC